MKNAMRITSVLMAAAIGITGLSGCGKKETVSSGATKVVWWDSSSNAKRVTEKLVKEFNETTGKEKNIYIDYSFKEDAGNKISVALSSGGEIPDFISGNLVEMADKGQIAAIDDMPQGKEFLEKYNFYREGTNGYKGKTYTVPVSSQLYGLVYNKDMFKAAGIVDENGDAKAPETWEELRADAKKLTNKSKKQFGIIFPAKWSAWYSFEIAKTFMAGTGVWNGYDTKSGTYDFSIYKPIFDTIVGIKDDESYYPGAENVDNDPARARFAEGNIGMKFAVSWDVGVLNDQFPAKCDWGVAPMPSIDKDKKYMQEMTYGYAPYISSKAAESDRKDAVWEVYKWMCSDEVAVKYYKECIAFPWNSEIVKDVKVEKPKAGWEDFTKILSISKMIPQFVFTDTSKYTPISKNFVDHIWSDGTMTTEEVLNDWTKAMNDGIKEYKKNNPDYDASSAIDPSYDTKR